METGTTATAAFGFLLAALKKSKLPSADRPLPPQIHKDRDEFLVVRNREMEELERSKFLEASTEKVQSECEWYLERTIVWREAYIYRHLMSKWFRSLCEKYRYDRLALEKARSDWLVYLSLLEHVSVSGLLSIQTSHQDMRDSYKLQASEGRKSYMTIENDFATQIGEGAVQLLQRARESADDAFDRSGKEEMAPTGYHYFCVSFDPYKEELRPKEFARLYREGNRLTVPR